MILRSPRYNPPQPQGSGKRSELPCPVVQTTDFSSLALGCHPKQAKGFNEKVRAHGCTGLYYDEQGNCRVTSKRDYDSVTKSLGFQDLPTSNIEPIKP